MVRRLTYLLLLLCIIVGCGGGGTSTGGGGGGTSTITYTTDWTNRAKPGGGVSQRVSLFTQQMNSVRSFIVNYQGTSTSSVTFPNLASGTYVLRSELFSASDLGGNQTGQLDSEIVVNGNANFMSKVGATVASLRVTPNSKTIQLPGSSRFFALPLDAQSSPTFAAVGSIAWQLVGLSGSIGTDGLFLASQSGVGTVKATHTPSAATGSASVTVQTVTPVKKKWTILVYMNAANDLFASSDVNMNQIERAAGNSDVRFVVQWKQTQDVWPKSSFNGTRRYLAVQDNSNQIASPIVQDLGQSVDMGAAQSLNDFIAWGKQFYPADRYGIVVWNHGNGWRRRPGGNDIDAVSYDDQTNNAIQTWQLKNAFAGQHFDFIAWDSSLMQMTEVAYEIRTFADYIVGSEESPPALGYPYQSIFSRFRDNPNDTTANLTKAFVDGMVNEPSYTNEHITQSVLDTSKIPALVTAINNLSNALVANNSTLGTLIPNIRSTAQSYSDRVTPPRWYRDLYDICLKLEEGSSVADIKTSAAAVRQAITNCIVWEGHNSHSPGSHGISIDFSQSSVFLGSSADYSRMEFAGATHWDTFLSIAP